MMPIGHREGFMSTALAEPIMGDEGAGNPPVVILREETNVTSGTAVQESLISAARVVADILRPTYGPRGLDKMLYNPVDGRTAVTNDGAKILAELMIKHPAGKMLAAMAESHENSCGDGVTGTILLSAELLIEAGRLLEKGLHPLTVIDGYNKACSVALATISELAMPPTPDSLEQVAITSLTGKGAEGAVGILSKMIVEALNMVEADADFITMHKTNVGSLVNSKLIHGIVVRRRILLDSLPSQIDDAKVATINGDIAPRKQIRSAEIEIEHASQLDAFLEAEEATRDSLAKTLLASGANVFICSGSVDKGLFHRLMRAGCFVAGEFDVQELRNASLATGARIIEHISDITSDDIGLAGRLSTERRAPTDQVEDIIRLESCPSPKVVTCEIGGANSLAAEEAIRAIHDGLRATGMAIRHNRIIHGGGATHMACALAIRESAEHEAGRNRLAMESFACALEAIPTALAQNAGTDVLDRILELRAAHRNGIGDAGITANGEVGPTLAKEAANNLESALNAATETCTSMLRIDQVVSARGD
jgi:chaperonin GroEL (HSP60 family)